MAWRLAAQLANEHGLCVRLFIDQPEIARALAEKELKIPSAQIRAWHDADAATPAPLIIATFGCTLPESYLRHKALQTPSPVWINFEYLSAETWVESHHRLPSTKADGGVEYFFYPGFSPRTGGLLRERDAVRQMEAMQNDRFDARFTVSLFCYPTAGLEALISAWVAANEPMLVLVPEGKVTDALGLTCERTQGALTLRPTPFTDQRGYDALLAQCDLNVARGEDSFVRTQWAGRPFLWHIYPTDDGAHITKMNAFFDVFTQNVPSAQMVNAWSALNMAFVRGNQDLHAVWSDFARVMRSPDWKRWRAHLCGQPDAATQLIEFAKEKGFRLE